MHTIKNETHTAVSPYALVSLYNIGMYTVAQFYQQRHGDYRLEPKASLNSTRATIRAIDLRARRKIAFRSSSALRKKRHINLRALPNFP